MGEAKGKKMNEVQYARIILDLERARGFVSILIRDNINKDINEQTKKAVKEIEKLSIMVTSHYLQVQRNGHH